MERFVGAEVCGPRGEQFVPISRLMHQVKAVQLDDGLPQGLLLVERTVPRPQDDLDNRQRTGSREIGDRRRRQV